ncbi:hypothetical protein ABDB91_11575 [Desulfoscipio sp. XC116]|uniref:hypothetical protein n=1 Tax=Desulfoscipio sp. XC116 TaxID=3144975 RepID=UPI00325BA8DC
MHKKRVYYALVVFIICLFVANSTVFAYSELVDDQGFAAPVLKDSNKIDLLQVTNDENSLDEPSTINSSAEGSSPGIICAVWAKLSLDKKKQNFKYYGKISSKPVAQKLSIRAELQYASPAGGKWIREQSVRVVEKENTSNVETATGIYGVSWGQWRCKAVGSYCDTRFVPSSQASTDYSKIINVDW